MRPRVFYGLIFGILVCSLCIILLVVSYFESKKSHVSNAYSITGTINIPYAGIVEPFKAWYNSDLKLSRIDYYNGTVKTYFWGHAGKYGVQMEIVPVTTENYTNEFTCFRGNGSRSYPIIPQDVLPDFSSFERVDIVNISGYECERWRKIIKTDNRTSTYTIWLRWQGNVGNPMYSRAIPVRYEMNGYNTLFGSHYDQYYLEYDTIDFATPHKEIFDLPPNVTCNGKPITGRPQSNSMNPMRELIDGDTSHVDEAWEQFKSKHSKSYDSMEHEKRKDIFRNNLRYIHSMNRQGLGYTLQVNHLADTTKEEFGERKGRLYKSGYNGGDKFPFTRQQVEELSKTLPKKFDWRLLGAVTPVKDQAICGSCWSFSTTGALEGAYFIKTKKLTNFSEQALIDCSWGYGNVGCNGGETTSSFKWIMKHGGIPTGLDYGQYLGADGFCHFNDTTMWAPLKSYVNVTSGYVKALQLAVVKYGPVAVSIDASQDSIKFYSSGIYYEKGCHNSTKDLDHAVLVVGYGTDINGKFYWLVKNSWSTHWGDQGYIKMASLNCGIETAPNYVILE